MKRKLSLLLALCLMLGSFTPALEAKAASVVQEEVSLVTEDVVEEVTEETEAVEMPEITTEDSQMSEEVPEDEIQEETGTPEEEIVSPEESVLEESIPEEVTSETEVEEEDILADAVVETVPEEIVEEQVEEVVIETVTEVQETEEKLASTEVFESGKFSGTWSADRTDVAVNAYAYGADFLLARKGNSGYVGTLDASGVLVVEKAAEIDLTTYADNTTRYFSGTSYSIKNNIEIEEKTVMVDGNEETVTVRFLPTESTSCCYNYIDNSPDIIYAMTKRVYGLEPNTEYEYLFVDTESYYNSSKGGYEIEIFPALETDETAVQRFFATEPATEETPDVSIDSIDAGYLKASAKLKFQNLNGQKIIALGMTSEYSGDVQRTLSGYDYKKMEKTENLPADAEAPFSYYEWIEELSHSQSIAPDGTETQIKPYIIVNKYTETGYVETRYEGNSVSVTSEDTDDLEIKESDITYITDTSAQLSVKFSNVVLGNDIYCKVLYKSADSDTWEETYAYTIYTDDKNSYTNVDMSDLENGTVYEYKLVICNSGETVELKTFEGGTFTTEGEAVTLTKEDIPDDALWKYLVGDAETVSSADLLEITSLSLSSYQIATYGTIKDLTGIGYLKNLKTISIMDHEISDLTPLLECARLTSLQVSDNNLTSVPDLSGLKNLTFINLNYNHIKNSDLSTLKYPEGADVNYDNQTPALEMAVGSTTVCKETKDSETYTLKFVIDHANSSRYGINLKIEDITDTENVLEVFNNVNLNVSYTSKSYEEYNGRGYTYVAYPAGMMLEEGMRTLRFTWDDGDKNHVKEITVNVDPNAVGGTWEIPDEKVPADVKAYMLSNWDMQDFDKNDDDIWSYDEVAAIDSFSIYSSSTQFTDFSFLQYMTELESLSLSYQTKFTNETLAQICQYENVKNLTTIDLSEMPQISDLSPLTENVKGLNYLQLWGLTEIKDISSFAEFTKLKQITLYSMKNLTGLSALKNLPITYIYCDNDTFSDQDIFNFICNKEEVSVKAGKSVSLVSTMLEMKDTSSVNVVVSDTTIADASLDNPLYVYGFREGETTATISCGDDSYTVRVKVTEAEFDYDPPVGETVAEADRMKFSGTEGLENARISRTLVDSSNNIWDITTRTPEKVMEGSSYTKYASRILYEFGKRFQIKVPVTSESFPMYLDNDGTLWAFSENYNGEDDNFAQKTEVMRNVADWQEGGYSHESYHSIYDNYVLILRTDGSLWYVGYTEFYNDGNTEFTVDNTRVEMLEGAGTVKSVHTHSYLTKDGKFYQTYPTRNGAMYKKLIADNVTGVWDNSAVTVVQDSDGIYYSETRKQDMQGTVKEYLVGNYYNPEWIKKSSYGYMQETGEDMLASYLLMEDGTLYRSEDSTSKYYKDWAVLDTGVTDIEKDYYWKGSTLYAYNGKTYANYIGSGAGRGVYPVPQNDGTMTLYVNGVPYLTKVVDWVFGDKCVYAIRTDNTLWQFDESRYPSQVLMEELSTEVKDVPKNYTEVDITNLKSGVNSIGVEWEAVSGAASYNVYTSTSSNGEMSCENVTACSWNKTGLNENTEHYFKIEALDSSGTVIGGSWKFYTYTAIPVLTLEDTKVTLTESGAEAEFTVNVSPSELEGDEYGLKIYYVLEYASDEETGEVGGYTEYTEYFDFTKGGTYTLKLTNLVKNSYYGAYIYLTKNSSNVTYVSVSFDTEPHLYLTEKEIPDAALRSALKDYSRDLDLYELQKRSYIGLDNPDIKDLTGLELLTGLTSLEISCLDAEVIDPAKFSTKLERLEITSCNLTAIPDLSSLQNLRDLDLAMNTIADSEFVKTNPALSTFVRNYKERYGEEELDYWMENQKMSQLGDPIPYIADAYYLTVNGTYPFIMEVARIDASRGHKLEVYDGEKLIGSTSESSMVGGGRTKFEIDQLDIAQACEKELEIVITDLMSDEEIYREEKAVTFKASLGDASEVKYLPTSFWGEYISGVTLSNEQFMTLYNTGWNELEGYENRFNPNGILTDSLGKTLEVSYQVSRNRYYPEEYDIFMGGVSSENRVYRYSMTADIRVVDGMQTLSAGPCKLSIYGYDGETVAVELNNLVEVTSAAIVDGVGVDRYNFDTQGEYLYVMVHGSQLEGQTLNLKITDEKGNNVSSESYEKIYMDSLVYKIHLDEEYRNLSYYYYEVTNDEVYGYTSGSLYVNRESGYVYGLYGDEHKNEIVGYASAKLKDGTRLVARVVDYDDNVCGEYGVKVENREIHIPFVPEEDMYYDAYRILFMDGDEELNEITVSEDYIYNANYITTEWVNDLRYLKGIKNVSDEAVIKLYDPKDYKLITSWEVNSNCDFKTLDLSKVEGGKLYVVVAEYGDTWAARKGYFNVKTETSDLAFNLTDPYGNPIEEIAANKYVVPYTSEMKNKVFSLKVATVGNGQAGIKAVSSSTSVAAVKVAGKSVSVTAKAAGTTNIKVTASDNSFTETVVLEFRDYTPKFESTSVAINKALVRDGRVIVYPVYGTELTDVQIDETKLTAKELKADYAKYFDVEVDDGAIKVALTDAEKASPLKAATYRLPLTLLVDGMEIPASVSVKLTISKPKVTVKQNEKINLFYTDTKAVLGLAPNMGEVEDVKLTDTTYFEISGDSDFEKGVVVLVPKSLETLNSLSSKELSKALKVQLELTVGETVWTQSVTLSKATAKPSITLSQTSSKVYKVTEDGETIFIGKEISFTPIDKKTKAALENVEVVLTGYSVTKKGVTTQTFSPTETPTGEMPSEGFTLTSHSDGSYTIYFVGNATATATITVQGDNWKEAMKATYKATVTTSKISAKLGSSKVTLNQEYKDDKKSVLISAALPYENFELGEMTVTVPKKAVYKPGDIEITKTDDGTGIVVSLKDDVELLKGTYKVSIPVTFTFLDGTKFTPKNLSLSVSVIDEPLTVKALKWKSSGKLNAIDRENDKITLTPTVSKLNATVADVFFSEADMAAALDQKLNMEAVDGKVVISLKDETVVSTKDKYIVHPVVTLVNEDGTVCYEKFETAAVTLKPTQATMKVKVAPKQAIMYQYATGTHEAVFEYALKGAAGAKITNVTLTNMTQYFDVEHDADNQQFIVKLKDSSVAVKTHTLKLAVTYDGQASNVKPMSVSVKVVVKK